MTLNVKHTSVFSNLSNADTTAPVVYGVRDHSATQVELFDTAETDFRLRRSFTLKVKDPKPATGSPSGYTQARTEIMERIPVEVSTGKYTTCSVGLNTSFDVSVSDANREKMVVSFIDAIIENEAFRNALIRQLLVV